AGVLEEHLIELAPHDLPGLRALVRLVVPEVERGRQLSARADELHAVLLDEVALLHLRQHVQPAEHPVGLRDERFADVKAGKALGLEQLAPAAALREQRGRRRARGSAANHHYVRAVAVLSGRKHPSVLCGYERSGARPCCASSHTATSSRYV